MRPFNGSFFRSAKSKRRRRPGKGCDVGRNLHVETLEARALLAVGPQLIAVSPNEGSVLSDVTVTTLNVAPKNFTFTFDDNQVIDKDTLADGIRITRSGMDGVFGDAQDVVIDPGFLGIGDAPNEVIFRFAETIPDDRYRIDIFGLGGSPLRNTDGEAFDGDPNEPGNQDLNREFVLDLGAQVIAIVPQPVTRDAGQLSQARDQIVVYFNNDDLLDGPSSAENPEFYQLIFTNDTVSNTDDEVFLPTSVAYDANANTAVLTFAGDLDTLPLANASTSPLSGRTYRLRIGTAEPLPLPPQQLAVNADPGSSFESASDLDSMGFSFEPGADMRAKSVILSSTIDPELFPLDFPGSNDDIGHRDINVVANMHLPDDSSDAVAGISEFAYNFRDVYGVDPLGNDLHNVITERQKDRAREVFELYGNYLGVQFFETEADGFTIVTGDLRAVSSDIATGIGGALSYFGDSPGFGPTAIMEAAETWEDGFGENWFREALLQVGHLLGLGDTFDLPEGTITGFDPRLTFGAPAEPVFPGDHDLVHGQHLYRPESNDIDLYRFTIPDTVGAGLFTAETIAERRTDSSLLDTSLRLYREMPGGGRVLLAQNDDYFSEDSFIELSLEAGTYFVGVSASGNDQYDPTIEETGFGGTSQGDYDLRLSFRPNVSDSIVDATGVALDGDADGQPGGVYNFWFRAQSSDATIFVDKSYSGVPPSDGTIGRPFSNVATALAAASPDDIVRIVGNDSDEVYAIGFDRFSQPLEDGTEMSIPQGVTVMVDAGAIFKMRRSVIEVGSSSPTLDRSVGALQILGTPEQSVILTSADDESIGNDINPLPTSPDQGDWGGIILRSDLDEAEGNFIHENEGVFLNYINHADMRYGGGSVVVNSVQQVVNPITMTDTRPTISFNTITHSADAAMSASPDSFEETNFHARDTRGVDYQATPFTSDYDRIGPDIHGNHVIDNSINGLFVAIQTPAASTLQQMTVSGRWDDTDIVHVVAENLVIGGTPGGPLEDAAMQLRTARTDAGLVVDPGTVVKLEGARIEGEMGTTFIAEGTPERPIVFTSLRDGRYGAGGTFDTNNDEGANDPAQGNWAGISFGHLSTGTIDHAVIAYGGGISTVEGSFTGFNTIEVHQANARITHSVFENNGSGFGGAAPVERFGRGFNEPATIFVRGAQPIIVDNVFRNNDSPVVNINVNALNHHTVTDHGRATGLVEQITEFGDNQGPMIRGNRIGDNTVNGMEVRGGTLTTESVWDDVDIVHVLRDTVFSADFHAFGGLRLESSPSESLVIKLDGPEAGFTSTGIPLEIDDRIGGRVQVVGQPGRPVVMTSIDDDSVGAGFDPQGLPQTDTNNGGRPNRTLPAGSFEIDVNFGPVISAMPDALAAVDIAVSLWEKVIQDPITVVLDFELAALGPGVLGGATPDQALFGFNQVRSRMIADAGEHESFLEDLPVFNDFNATLPQDALNQFTVDEMMSLSRANAKALGLTVPGGVLSQYDVTGMEFRDADIEFTNDPTTFDFNRKDGTEDNRIDFVSVVVHEIGHALGFISAVDIVDGALGDPAVPRNIQLNTLDLFRLAPGTGQDDFTSAARLLDPRVADHVFFDGGEFDVTGIPIERLENGDIPLSTGAAFGDGGQASHWRDDIAVGDFDFIGIMDPTAVLDLFIDILEPDRVAFDLIGYDVVGGGEPGDWKGVSIEQNSHDRNALLVNEQELPSEAVPGSNAFPASAQFVGQLAPDLKAGDDNLPLAFEIHGLISEPGDVDIYSFVADAGTEVWLDIDRTSSALDSVVELVDANGNVLARSDNSLAEIAGTEFLVGSAQPLTGFDHYAANLHDAGMRVTLPGPDGTTNTYQVRVRSSSADLDGDLLGGLTSGQYQLQIRQQATDEIPGSRVEYADIRFATIGVEIVGPPIHSPLVGTHVEDGSFNDLLREDPADGFQVDDDRFIPDTNLPTHVAAQNLGNLLNSDRGAFSVFGVLDAGTDVDWYEFQVAYDAVQVIPGVTDPTERTAGVVFDIDYADGLARPNTVLSVYDETGTLIYYSEDSNVADDRPAPGGGADLDDLSRGTVGSLDPFIGPVELTSAPLTGAFFPQTGLPLGLGQQGTYFVAVSSIAMLPTEVANNTVGFAPVVAGLIDRGQQVTGATLDSTFSPNPSLPPNQNLTGEYQLDIRYTPIPEDGFDATNATAADKNRENVQGQIVVANTTVVESSEWGIVVDDGERDLPQYLEDDPRLYERQDHAQYTNADYVPHNGAVRSLAELNKERIVPGLTIENNVIAENVRGGIHFKGDPNGFVIRTYNLEEMSAVCEFLELDNCGADAIDGRIFTIRDIHGNEETFEFDNTDYALDPLFDGADVEPGNIPVRFDLDPINDFPIFDLEPHFSKSVALPTIAEQIAGEIEFAINSTTLDVDVIRGEDNSLFIEGATRIVANIPEGDALLPLANGIPFPLITRHVAQQGAVPFARILNNTIVGRGGDLPSSNGAEDVGILIEDNASPTLLNNLIVNFDTALQADPSSTDEVVDRLTFVGPGPEPFDYTLFTLGPLTNDLDDNDQNPVPTDYFAPRPTVLGANLYQGNLIDTTLLDLGDFAIELANDDPLLVDRLNGNYLLDEGSLAIDSSVNSVPERDSLVTVTQPLGIAPSPILAPDTDQLGQLRVDDPSVDPPDGIGLNVFKDRGALDRVDFVGPTAVLRNPVDNDAEGEDQDPSDTNVFLTGGLLTPFEIEMADGIPPADPARGTGVDDLLVTADTVMVTRNDVLLVEGIDYRFAYDATSDLMRLTPLAGLWEPDSVYVITLDNMAIRDRANNRLNANQTSGETKFTIVLGLGLDFGDAPDPTYPTLQASSGAGHAITETLFLGAQVDAEEDGQPTSSALGDSGDDGVVFNTALEVGADATITVTASEAGLLDAWIDINGDGDWNDLGEQILVSEAVAAGANIFVVPIPLTAKVDATYARFRLSSSGGLAPTGIASDGEVEDYRIDITGNPWHNAPSRENVNGVGGVDASDVIAIINELNDPMVSDPTTGMLPNPAPFAPPPFYDVNNDGFISPVDALIVINFINALSASSATASSSTASAVAGDETAESDSLFGRTELLVGSVAPSASSETAWPGLLRPSLVEIARDRSDLLEPATAGREASDPSMARTDLLARSSKVESTDAALAASDDLKMESLLSHIADDIAEEWRG